ncbi:hypothetical protein H6784_01200 [Candidatus Nomurabacteria bacterium]|nr:hypothetical protein [Candidatus Kaiserbacteria bacterium]MCB9814010.1 hypothetical protein [Candidatus Nomurabacteria bacterium]
MSFSDMPLEIKQVVNLGQPWLVFWHVFYTPLVLIVSVGFIIAGLVRYFKRKPSRTFLVLGALPVLMIVLVACGLVFSVDAR